MIKFVSLEENWRTQMDYSIARQLKKRQIWTWFARLQLCDFLDSLSMIDDKRNLL